MPHPPVPMRRQTFDVSAGTATVFYPVVDAGGGPVVLLICRDAAVARTRFRAPGDLRRGAASLVGEDSRAANMAAYAAAYRRYVWPTDGLDGVRVAPFQVLAADGAVYGERDHEWHLSIATTR